VEFGAGVVFAGFSLEPVDPDFVPDGDLAESDDTGGKEYGAAVSDLAVSREFPLTTRGDLRPDPTSGGSVVDATIPSTGPITGTLSAGEDTSWIRPPITPRAGSPT
jgi:hypothetical protein